MQYKTLSVAFFAALASAAHQHAPRGHYHHRRAFNETGPLTTLTVIATEIHTITSCAATVTDCPSRPDLATSEFVVTETKVLSTTVCPVKDASSISSQIVSNLPTKPVGTGSGPSATSAQAGPTTDATLTYTLGTGTSTTVVTTTIKHTSTETLYATSTDEFKGVRVDDKPTGATGGNGAEGEPTTTVSSTMTSTRYITVFPAPSGTSADSGSGCAPVTVTVAVSTVTIPASTVTVTETAAATCPTQDSVTDKVFTSTQAGEDTKPTTGSGAAPTDSDVVIVPTTKTVVPVAPTSAPYPTGNGTNPYPTGLASPSGFVTRPVY